MSKIKDWAIEQIESDSNVDLEFREALAGFHKSCDKIEEAIDNFVSNDYYFDDDAYQMEVDNCLSHGEDYR